MWIRPTRRWALFLRGGLRCVYCQVGVEALLADDLFLTLDHVRPRSDTAGHGDDNLVVACYSCNRDRNKMAVRRFCLANGFVYSNVAWRILRQRKAPLDRYTGQAEVMLGRVGSRGADPLIQRHDLVTARQWQSGINREYLDYIGVDRLVADLALSGQATLWCPTCGSPRDRGGEEDEEEVGF